MTRSSQKRHHATLRVDADFENMQNVAFLAAVFYRLVDALADDIQEAFARIEIQLKRSAVGLHGIAVIDKHTAG